MGINKEVLVDPIFVRRRDVEKIVGLSYSTFNNMEKVGQFPKRVHLTIGRVVWDYSDLISWATKFKTSASHS